MSPQFRKRRTLSLLAAMPLALAACGGADQASNPLTEAGSLADVCAAAAEESGEALWYESSLPEQTDQIIAAFHETYPDVGVVHQRVTGGAGISGQVIQERHARARTADLVTASPDIVAELADRGHLHNLEAEDLDVTNQELMLEPYAVHTTSTVPVLLYNTDLVTESDISGTWDDFTDPKWAGQTIMWNRSGVLLSNLVPEWGETRTREYIEALAESDPVLNESTFNVAQQVGAGTNPVGFGLYHTTHEVQETGAPIEIRVLDPVPVSPLYSGIVNEGPNPMSAECFLGWLVSEEGALAYEQATYRGNHLIEGTQTRQLIEGTTVSMMEFSEVDQAAEYIIEYNEILAQ